MLIIFGLLTHFWTKEDEIKGDDEHLYFFNFFFIYIFVN